MRSVLVTSLVTEGFPGQPATPCPQLGKEVGAQLVWELEGPRHLQDTLSHDTPNPKTECEYPSVLP